MKNFRPGDIVEFTDSSYKRDWGVGMVLRPDKRKISSQGGKPVYFYVLTAWGEKLIAGCFMKIVQKHTPCGKMET